MPNVLRLRRSNAPEPNRNSEAIYANADGELKQVAPDGSETDLGGSPGGGSQTGAVRWIGPCKVSAFDGQYLYGFGSADGGTVTLTVNGATTAPLSAPLSGPVVQAALEALPSIGEGKVIVDLLYPNEGTVTFLDAVATELMTGDGSLLTGADSPYTVTVDGATSWLVEMLTPAVGDIIEDFMHAVRVGFDGEDASLYYTDDANSPPGTSPAWAMPTAEQGIDGLDITIVDSYTNFTGNGTGTSAADARSRPTALSALIAQWAASASDTSVNLYQNLPAMAVNSVPVYSYVKDVDVAPTQGEVWIWVKVSTPAAMDD